MGEVFFAWAYGVARTKKPVVVKVLRGEMLAEPGAPEMFVEEGRLSLRLSHQNVLQVFDFGKADDRYFMAMEWVDGWHLGELRKRAGGRLVPELAAFVTMEVCLALDYAHRLKDESGQPLHIVHRDVTPSNVLISREGEVKLADFGIARATGRSQHTQAGQIRGKVRYMSPEAARGEPLDQRADIFSLGTVLFEMLTGRRAFEAKAREAILQQVVGSRVAAPSSVEPGIPAALDEVVVRATAPRREERYPDAFAMHRAIEEACRKAGLAPSRGAFLEFLRALDAADAAAEAARWSEAERITGAAPPPQPAPAASPSGPSISLATPAPAGAMAPGEAPVNAATQAVPPPGVPGAPGSASGSAPRQPRPSSASGNVPAAVKGPETALPTGVASPVLFTLTVAPEPTPAFERAAAELVDLPLFEVTRGEGIAVDFREVERMTPHDDRFAPRLPDDDDVDSRKQTAASAPPADALPAGAAPEETYVREPTPAAPVNEATVPPVRAPSASRATAVPDLPSTEDTVPPLRIAASAAETEIRMRPVLEERSERVDSSAPTPPSRPRTPRPTGSGSGPSVRGRTGAGRPAPPVEPEPATGDSRDTVDHVSADPVRPVPSAVRITPGVDYPAPRPRPRTSSPGVPVLAAVLVALILGGAWLGTRLLDGVRATTPAPRPTVIARATPVLLRTPEPRTPTPAPIATAVPERTPAPTPLAVRTVRPTPRPVRTPVVERPTPVPTAAPVVAIQFGALTANTQPWSEVRANGKLLGTTPLKNVRLPAGRHTLSFRNPVSGLEKVMEVEILPNQTRTLLVELQ